MNRKITLLASAMLILPAALIALTGETSAESPPAPTEAPSADAQGSDWAMGPVTATAATPAATRTVNAMADALFNDPDTVGETRALIVLQNGQPLLERYGEGFGPDSKLISWSMAKTVTAVLTGMLVAEGRLALDEPAPVPAWQRPGDARNAITLRHLLHMSSGLNHIENGEPVWESDTVAMLFGEGAADMAGAAEAQPLIARPDEIYNYSSATSVILSDIITRQLTPSDNPALRRDAMLRFVRGRLAGPLGMTSLTPEFDERGTMIGGSIMHATARDWARFGEFLRRGGTTRGGQRLLPESWMRFMLTPTRTDGGYGGHIWLNRQRPAGSNTALWPEHGPADLYAALGHQGQFIVISPSQRLTVVRLGISTRDQIPAVRDRLRQLMAAL
jgi:CubicO group peptidase (beta-lactamase class C family)